MVPHWNAVYPVQSTYQFTCNEIKEAEAFYKQHGQQGHLLLTGQQWKNHSVVEEEYFYLDAQLESQNSQQLFNIQPTDNIERFCDIVQTAFEFDAITHALFLKKMTLYSTNENNIFWLLSHEGSECGCITSFQTVSGAQFLFNFGVLPEYQQRGLGTSILKKVLTSIDLPIYIYSPNMAMRTKTLPKVGFISAGMVYTVPLSEYYKVQSR